MIGSAIDKRPTKKVYGQINLIWRAAPREVAAVARKATTPDRETASET
jgi:hypothetical protein